MLKIFKFTAGGLLYALAAVLIGWTGYRTYHLLSLTTANPIVPFLGLAVFDGGFVVWTFYFLNGAEGASQRGTAFGASLLNLLLVALATVADVWLGGQTLVQVDPQYGTWALWLISGATGLNLFLMWLAHMTDPNAQRQMKMREAQDKILEETYRQLDAKTDDIAAQVADVMSGRMVDSAVASLLGDKARAKGKAVAPVQSEQPAQEAQPALPMPKPMPIPELAEPVVTRRNGHKTDPKA